MESSGTRGEELLRERWPAFRLCGQVVLYQKESRLIYGYMIVNMRER
jgi:hypothetical protein